MGRRWLLSGADPFSLLGLPRRFRCTEEEIRKAQRTALSRLHPDRERTPVAREAALRASAEVNQAARILLDPRQRAEWLIRNRAGAAEGADAASTPGAVFLMEMLELRDELSAAQERGDAAEIQAFTGRIEASRDEVLERLAAALDGPGGEPGAALAELRFVLRLLEQAREGAR